MCGEHMKLFDTHCHLDFAVFAENLESEWQLAQQVGVKKCLIPSIGPSNWRRVATLATQFDGMYYALGFHPYFLQQDWQEYAPELATLLGQQSPQCVAIGECGLDAMVKVDMATQEAALLNQFELAKQYQLPVILHSRKTHNRLIQLVKQAQLPKGGVIHGFTGSLQQAQEWTKLGFKVGVGGSITYPRANKTRNAIAGLNIDNLVLETDAPDMPLNGFQGQSNHPKQLPFVLKQLALLHNTTTQTIAISLWKNSHSLFSICE